ncbi:unnamed protein product [Durusdinium trenchii]|uniref:1,4-alpha-glucan branching enzyme n=1 Tax=Durusdinium trenchii TaxID=1381693 RepID=A0ABP0MHH6_9DINO
MLPVFKDDPHLCSHESRVMHRINAFRGWKEEFRRNEGGIDQFAEGYNTFGFQRHELEHKWTFTEWLPEARKAFLIGDFNNWENTHPLQPGEFGRWSIDLPDKKDGKWAVPHRSQFRLRIQTECGTVERVPAWTKLARQNLDVNVLNGVMWEPPPSARYRMRHARPHRPENLKIYEAHLGIAGREERTHSYLEFKEILPRIKRLGYNALQIMAVAEHASHSSFGYEVTNFFAPCSRFGTPEELKELVDTAHAYGLTVLMDLAHSHCSSNQIDGIAAMDGTDNCYTHRGHKGKQEQWGASLFDYSKYEVLRFLLSNLRWWIEEYGFDGFRFGGVTSMLYISHGIGKRFGHDYHQYFGGDADIESGTYLMLANYLVKRLLPRSGLTIAEDSSGMPTLCRAVDDGGFGFDYCLSVNIPGMWTKMLQEQPDETWSVSRVVKALQKRRFKEPCIAFSESYAQAMIGSKTLASCLMDAEMYAHMSIKGPQSMVIDRGLALHKMIRLVSMALGGEGYLNFIGNEFAHPDYVELPSQDNGWSFRNAIRRFDLPDAEDLKYKFFEAFDEAMLALDNRFQFMASPRSFCSRKDDSDKVIAFEHGDCLFVFNFHPSTSYTDYRVGHSWNESLRVVLDSDAACFGGQNRLSRERSLPPLDGWDSRYHSTELFLPSRTAQVLVRESLVQGGVTVLLGTGPTSAWPFPAGELLLAPVDADGTISKALNFTTSQGRLSVKLPGPTAFKVYWEVQKGGVTRGSRLRNQGATKVKLPFALETFRVYFPGTYVLDHLGNLKCVGDATDEGDGVPQGCKDAPTCLSRPQYVRAKSQKLLAPSEMPEEPNIEAASHNVPDSWIDVRSPKLSRHGHKDHSTQQKEVPAQEATHEASHEVQAEDVLDGVEEMIDADAEPQPEVEEEPTVAESPEKAEKDSQHSRVLLKENEDDAATEGHQEAVNRDEEVHKEPEEMPQAPSAEMALPQEEMSKVANPTDEIQESLEEPQEQVQELSGGAEAPQAVHLERSEVAEPLVEPKMPQASEVVTYVAKAQQEAPKQRRRSQKARDAAAAKVEGQMPRRRSKTKKDFKPPVLQASDLAWLQGVRKVPLQQSSASSASSRQVHSESEPQVQEAQKRDSQKDACDFLAMFPATETLTREAVKASESEPEQKPVLCQRKGSLSLLAESSKGSEGPDMQSSDKQETKPVLCQHKGSMSLLPESSKASEGTDWQSDKQETKPVLCQHKVSEGTDLQSEKQASRSKVDSRQDASRSHSRRRRRRSRKEQTTRSRSQRKDKEEEQLKAMHAARMKALEEEAAAMQATRLKALEEEHAAAMQAARIKALQEEQAAKRKALEEAQAARMQLEAEEAAIRKAEELKQNAAAAAALQATRAYAQVPQDPPALLMHPKGSMSLVAEPEAPKAPQQEACQVSLAAAKARQVAQPKFARGAPRSSKSLPPRKEVPVDECPRVTNTFMPHQVQQAQTRLMEEPPMLNYRSKQGSFSLLPDLDAKQCRIEEVFAALEAEHTDLPQDEVQEASSLSLPDGVEVQQTDKDSKEGHTTPTSGTQTPKTKAVSDANSDSGPDYMERVFSLSALDSLLQDPEGKAELRHQLELDELEDKRPKYTSHHLSRPVVVVSSEVNPWSKTGGLAMVAGSYGYEFAMRGHRTMVVSPRYAAYDGAHYIGYTKVWLDGREHEVQFFHLYQDLGDGNGTDYIFVSHECFSRGGLYCDPKDGKEYPDNLFRFSLLTVAALEAPLILNIRGSTFGQDVLFIANDWQTGLLPVYHLYKYRRNNTYRNSRCMFVIHNIGYQGKYRLSKFPIDSYLGLPPEAVEYLQGEDLNLGNDCMNLLSAACLASDRVLTVSPNYAAEIQSPEGGQGLHQILQDKGRQNRMAGILNGIADEWNPKTDPHIPVNYGLRTFEEGKAACKKDLQRSLGLHEDPGAALIGFCGRLCYQKGVHLITQIIPWLLTYEASGVLGRVQVILMGKGEDTYASQLSNAENHNKGRVCGYVGFDPKIEHRMLAGCDFLLMPSQYEPCGLPQMYAQAYGTVPVVHETGGLKDSVLGLWDEQRDRETATGFLFCGFDENHLKERMYQALEVYHKKQDLFKQIQMNGLRTNYYWPQAIDEYERQIDWTLDNDLAAS